MKAKYIKRITFADKTSRNNSRTFAYKDFNKWCKKNPNAEVISTSEYCDTLDERIISIYFDKRSIK